MLPKLDVAYLLRMQRERRSRRWCRACASTPPASGSPRSGPPRLPGDALVMHPGPMNRGVEIAPEVADLPSAVITDQVANGVAVRMAVLYHLLGSGVPLAGAGSERREDADG